MMKTPDKWVILKICDGLYKVFGIWEGGYLDGPSWNLNSGIESVEEDENGYLFHGYSGSVYNCSKSSYGLSVYGLLVLKNILDKAEEAGLKVPEVLPNNDWGKVKLN